ncbi:MAG TPA: SDR family oxidoreductase [Thermodesulfobacteriaceae bacterium]|nr:SDR family oxidoreductase [Thermodesulfobacteriaceae bacterium]
MDLKNRVAVITGAIKGIGLAIAAELSRAGVRCVLSYYDWLDSLENMHSAMAAAGTEYRAISADLTLQSDAERLIRTAEMEFGSLDILINNIERGGWPVVHGRYTPEQWDLEFKTTVTAKWHLFQTALPVLKTGDGGTVVNISSIAGLTGRSGPAGLVFNDCYSLANRSLRTLTEIWAREGAPEVRVNELMLGFIDTRHGPGTRGWDLLDEREKADILDHTLLNRTGKVDEVAAAVRFLVESGTYFSGSVLRMDGGYVLGGERTEPVPDGVVQPGEPTFGGPVLNK